MLTIPSGIHRSLTESLLSASFPHISSFRVPELCYFGPLSAVSFLLAIPMSPVPTSAT